MSAYALAAASGVAADSVAAGISGAPVVEVSSIGGPAITVATTTDGAVTTFFAGHTVFAVPGPGKKSGHCFFEGLLCRC